MAVRNGLLDPNYKPIGAGRGNDRPSIINKGQDFGAGKGGEKGGKAIGKGNYAVEITNAFGCVDTSACVSINIASIETIALLNNVVVFTNPTQENVNIDLAGLKNVKVQLLNTQGQVLFIDENINSSVYQLNLNSLKGTYILKNESEQISKVIKVIKL